MTKRVKINVVGTILVSAFLAEILFPVFAQSRGGSRKGDKKLYLMRQRIHAHEVLRDLRRGNYNRLELGKVMPYVRRTDPLRYDLAKALHALRHDDTALVIESVRLHSLGGQVPPHSEMAFFLDLAKSQGNAQEAHWARSNMLREPRLPVLP